MRICVVYDCLYPRTVGGAARWYRNLAERLAARGHDVTYLTMRAWERRDEPRVEDVRVLAVAPSMPLYAEGRRRILPPLLFGLGVLGHLTRHGRRYDMVHTASFPYFPLLAAALVRRVGGYQLAVDWHEVWSRKYWMTYLGGLKGRMGWLAQQLCLGVPQRAFTFSRLHAARLRELRHGREPTLLEGEYAGPGTPSTAAPEPVVVFAGRHIPEKRVPALVEAIALAREQLPELRAEIFGDGPERAEVLRRVAQLGLDGVVESPGFVDERHVQNALGKALCSVLPSSREGYGLVVVEAAAKGTPSVVVAGADNAAVELVEPGRNGLIAPSADPEELASAILRIHATGGALRSSTTSWYRENERRLSLDNSVEQLLAVYGRRSANGRA